MRSIKSVIPAFGNSYPIIAPADLADRVDGFLITSARRITTKFGPRIAMDISLLGSQDADMRCLMLGDMPFRAPLVEAFVDSNEPIGPVKLVKSEKGQHPWLMQALNGEGEEIAFFDGEEEGRAS